MPKSKRFAGLTVLAVLAALAGCSSPPPMPPVNKVDIKRFMGDWYVIAGIPTWPERQSYNAVESYALLPDGRIQTTFRYRHGGFDAKVKTMRPVGTVEPDTGNAIWGMQFIWPIEADYRIVYVSPDYQRTIIGREKRDNVWIMARTPQVPAADFQELRDRVAREGYDMTKLATVPQEWPERANAPPRSAEEECS